MTPAEKEARLRAKIGHMGEAMADLLIQLAYAKEAARLFKAAYDRDREGGQYGAREASDLYDEAMTALREGGLL